MKKYDSIFTVIFFAALSGCSFSNTATNNNVAIASSQSELSKKVATHSKSVDNSDNSKQQSLVVTNNKDKNKAEETNTTKNKSPADHGLTEDFDTLTIEQGLQDTSKNSDWHWNLPAYFPTPRVPADNPMTQAKVELGRHLFYDKRLSSNGTTSCATCHLQSLAFTDGKAHAIGATGEQHPRSSMGLANVAYLPTLNWANPAITKLEDQLLTPMFGELPVEMGLTDHSFANVQKQFAQDKTYQKLFADAFGKNDKNGKKKKFSEPADYGLVEIAKAIASFERSIVSANSKFDQHVQGKLKLTDSEMRGKVLFFGEKAECHHCHGSLTFNDQIIHSRSRIVPIRFHNTGLYNLDENGSYIENNEGLFEVTANHEDKGKFRAPSLRNVAITAPYNHDGSTKTLEEVVANYANGGRIIPNQNGLKIDNHTSQSTPVITEQKSVIMKGAENHTNHIGDGRFNPNKSDLIVRINLNEEEQADIVAFLRTLTDESLLTNPNYANPWKTKDSIDVVTE